MVEKVSFTNCVFEKLCFLKTHFYSVFSKTQLFKNKNCMLKKTENLWKIVGCFWTWQNGVFGFVFWGFNVIVVCFWCVWHSSKSVKNAIFYHFWGFCGVAYSCLLGFGRCRCVCVCFSFLCCFCFCFVCFAFVLLLDCFWCCCSFGSVFFFCFFGGFKGQVRWPKGPPHLALNRPYLFIFLVFVLFFFFLLVLFVFWRV